MQKVVEVTECLGEDCFLCRNIMPEWLEVVRMQREVLAFKKGESIFKVGEEVRGIYFILCGRVKVTMPIGDKTYIARLASDGEILGHRGFGLDNIYPIDAVTLEPTTVCFIPTALFQKLLTTNHRLLYKLTFFYADELKHTERRMRNLVHMPVKGRVAESLIMVEKAFGMDEDGKLNYNISRRDLASMAGTTYETVIRALNELQGEQLIELSGKAILLKQVEKLKDCCI